MKNISTFYIIINSEFTVSVLLYIYLYNRI